MYVKDITNKKSFPFFPFTAKNTVISLNFLVWKFCGKAQFPHIFRGFARNYHSFRRFARNYAPETMKKLCLSTKFPHQEIR